MWSSFNLKELNKTHQPPSARGFCFLFGIIFITMGVWHFHLLKISVGIALLLAGAVRPSLFYYPNLIWHNLGLILGWFMTPIFLTLLYFIAFVPMALVAKVFGHKALAPKGAWIKKVRPCRFERIF